MNTLWHKIRYDLLRHKSRTLPAVASIAAGIFCVGAVFGMIDLQLEKMDQAHRRSMPSHISMILGNDADDALREKIKSVTGVGGIDLMTPVTVRFKTDAKSDWTMGTLIVRDDYEKQRYDLTTLYSGDWPEAGKIAVERLSARFAEIGHGDKVTFETASGGRTLQVGGVVRHPFIKPPRFGGQIHFFADSEAAGQFGIPKNTFRQLLVRVRPPYSEDKARNIAREIRTVLSDNGVAVNATLLQNPKRHWGRPFFEGIDWVLQAMAVAALLLASVLILNTVSARINQQVDQIGVMKALGASRTTIANVYLSETLLMALSAVVVALPAGLAAAYAGSCSLLDLFNIECPPFDYSGRAVSYMLLGGIAAPLLSALGPVMRGAGMSVREAMAGYGLGADFGTGRFDLWIERIGAILLPTLFSAALGNLFRRKMRLLLTQSVLIIAGTAFLVLMSLIASVNRTLDNELARTRYAVRLGFAADQSRLQMTELINQIEGDHEIEFWRRLPLEIDRKGKALHQKGSLGLQMLALPSGSVSYEPFIESGRWLKGSDAGRRVMVISADTALLNGLQPGDTVNVRLQGAATAEWTIIGVYRWLAGVNYAVEPVYAPIETLDADAHGPGPVSFALIGPPVKRAAEELKLFTALKQKGEKEGMKLDVYTTHSRLEQRRFARNQFRPVIATLSGLAAMIAAVGGIGLSGALAIGVLQRIREIGVLRAIGARSGSVFLLFLLEGMLHGAMAWSLSVPLALATAEPAAAELGNAMLGIRLDYVFDYRSVLYWMAAVMTLAWAASYWPARKAARLTIRECLGH